MLKSVAAAVSVVCRLFLKAFGSIEDYTTLRLIRATHSRTRNAGEKLYL